MTQPSRRGVQLTATRVAPAAGVGSSIAAILSPATWATGMSAGYAKAAGEMPIHTKVNSTLEPETIMKKVTAETMDRAKKALQERLKNNRKALGELRPSQDGFARLICAEIEADRKALAELGADGD